MKKTCHFKEMLDLIVVVNKFYQMGNLKPESKVKLLKLIRKLKEEEKKFYDLKQQVIEEEAKKDDKGKFITKKQEINGIMMDVYVFDNVDSYNSKMGPILDMEMSFDFSTLNIKLNDICATNLSIRDIDILIEYGIIKEDEGNDNKPKIITAKQ